MSGYSLHLALHSAVYVLGAAGVLSLLFSATLGGVSVRQGHLRFLGFLLATLAWTSYLADNLLVDARSPVTTITSPIVKTKSQYRKYRPSQWYVKLLTTTGDPTPWIVWLADRHPTAGTQVAMTVRTWNQGDPVELRILSGPQAGFVRQANSTVGLDYFLFVPALILLLTFSIWWIVYAASTAKQVNVQSTDSAAEIPG